jgi:tetratricopeptide (TPR) repeat protein
MSSTSGTSSKKVPETRSTVPSRKQADSPKQLAPRAIASLRLTEHAKLLIESKKPDDAIRTLEKAVNINPNNGRNYYFLAEAWLLKKNRKQAIAFNRIAEIYLNNDAAWTLKVLRQKVRIEKISSKR